VKLDRLKIPKYKNLVDFDINFDESQATTVVLGRNGMGKSNLLEALVEIFRDLELCAAPTFAYELQYICRDRTIFLSADPARSTSRLSVAVDGLPVAVTEFNERRDDYLPKYVFAYYSGWSSRLENHFAEPTRRHYNAVLKSTDYRIPLRRMFFCRKDYSQLVLLAFFLSRNSEAHEILREYLNIQAFDCALFALKRPWWGKSRRSNRIGDARFWSARGAFRGFLDVLWDRGLAPIRRTESVERDVRRQPERTDRLYLFIKDSVTLCSLAGKAEGPKEVFGYLESLFLCDLIDEVRVTVRRTDGTRLKFRQLSEGEQQLLTVLGLLLFTQEDESLYLLDEPDTHLNPVWTYRYLGLLKRTISATKGNLLIATHNPLMIGSLHKNQVRILNHDAAVTTSAEPESDPIGIGVEGLLKSELYGLRSSLAPEVLNDIDTQNKLLGLAKRTKGQDRELQEANTRLEAIGVTLSHPNPLFDLFAKAVASQPIFQKPVLSATDIEAQDKLANEILDGIVRESS
jgi:ABC-type transport system involved in cytochrome c biogenesis ATPase subunit